MTLNLKRIGTFIIFIAIGTKKTSTLTSRWQIHFDWCKSSVRQKLAAKVVKTELNSNLYDRSRNQPDLSRCVFCFVIPLTTETRLISNSLVIT